MEYKGYKLEIDKCSVDERNIIANYWAVTQGEFRNKATDLANRFNMSVAEMAIVVKYNSRFVKEHGKCPKCGLLVKTMISSQSEFTRVANHEHIVCTQCDQIKTARLFPIFATKDVGAKQAKLAKFNSAAERFDAMKLPAEEYDLLTKIAASDVSSFELIKEHLFAGCLIGKAHIWKALARLEMRSLVITGRDEGRILKTVKTHPAVIQKLKQNKMVHPPNKHAIEGAKMVDVSSMMLTLTPHQSRTFIENVSGTFKNKISIEAYDIEDGKVNLKLLIHNNTDDFDAIKTLAAKSNTFVFSEYEPNPFC